MLKTTCIGLVVLLGVAAVANGVLMAASPDTWRLAATGVTTTGPFNEHFLRDIGLIFLVLGARILIGAANPHLRTSHWAAAVALPPLLTRLLPMWAFREDRRA